MSKDISVSTGPIFTIFSPNGRYLHEFFWAGPAFPIPQGTLSWQPILCHKQNTNHVRFLQVLDALVGMIFQVFVRQSPKGRCYGNQLNMGDVRKRRMGPPLLFASAFDNGLADHKCAFKSFNGNNQATSYQNVVNFGEKNGKLPTFVALAFSNAMG